MSIYEFLALATIALAAYRITRVIVSDTITQSFRAWIWRRAYQPDGYDSRTDRETIGRRPGMVGWAWEKAFQLVDCPFCTGWHVTLAFYWAWHYWHAAWVRPVLSALAAVGMQAFVSSRRDA